MPPARRRALLLADAGQLRGHVAELARRIDASHPDGVTLVGVLKGSVVFLADLARAVTVPVRLEFLAVAPYDGASGRTRVVKDLDRSVEREHVVLVDAIVDTGLTIDFLTRHLRSLAPASLRSAPSPTSVRRLLPLRIDHVALEAPDGFLLGYGLGFAGRYRNLPDLWAADAAELAEDPDRYLALVHDRAEHRR